MNKILCTGSNGWLGRFFLNMFFDGSKDYPEYKYKKEYMRSTDLHGFSRTSLFSKHEYVTADITNYNDCLKLTKDIDIVVHIAGVIHAKPKVLIEVNTRGTENLVRASIENGVKKFIYISSNSAFGDNDRIMTEYTDSNPYMAYGRSKKMAEELLWEYGEGLGLIDVIVLRPCWFYGEGQPDRQTKLFKMIKDGKPMIFGDGSNLRSMSYIGNVSHAIIQAINKEVIGYEDYWISDDMPYTTNEIYHTIADLLEVDIKPRYIPGIVSSCCRLGDKMLQKLGIYSSYVHVAGEMDRSIACSIHKAKKDLDYDPMVDLKEGMKRSIEWCKTYGKI